MGLHYRGAPCPAADRLAAAQDAYQRSVEALGAAEQRSVTGVCGWDLISDAAAEVGRCRSRMLIAVDAFRSARDRADAMMSVGLGLWI